jgi:DNA-binding transcriptional LysR family regulator
MIESPRLRVLLAVARAGSLAGAAEALDYTPSAVSQQMRVLAREAGAPLLERRGRSVALTEPGRALARHAERVVEALDAAQAEVEAIAGLRSGLLRLGWFTTAGATLMPRAIARFSERHPEIELALVEGDPEECGALLRDGELDLALVYEFRLGAPLPRDVRSVELLEDRLYLALPRAHPLAGRAEIALEELAGERWIQGVRHGPTLDTVPSACREAGFEPQIAFRTDDHTAVLGLVAAGVGVALIPQIALPAGRRDIAVRPLEAHGLVRTVSVAMPPGLYTPPAAAAMTDLLASVAGELMRAAAERLRR